MRGMRTPAPGSPYYLPPEIFRHVVAYCRCYPRWKHARDAIASICGINYDGMPHGTTPGNPTETAVLRAYERYEPDKCKLIEDTVREVDEGLYRWLLKGVTEDVTYNYLKTRLGIPCGVNEYTRKRREIYWLIAQRI